MGRRDRGAHSHTRISVQHNDRECPPEVGYHTAELFPDLGGRLPTVSDVMAKAKANQERVAEFARRDELRKLQPSR